MRKLFTEHPEHVGETYWEHAGHASEFGVQLLAAGGACLVHAILPFLFVQTASKTIRSMSDRMQSRGTAPQAHRPGPNTASA